MENTASLPVSRSNMAQVKAAIASNCLIVSLLSEVYLFTKVTLPTLLAKQLVLVPLRRSFRLLTLPY